MTISLCRYTSDTMLGLFESSLHINSWMCSHVVPGFTADSLPHIMLLYYYLGNGGLKAFDCLQYTRVF